MSMSPSSASSASGTSDVVMDEPRSDYKEGGYHPATIGDCYHNGRYVLEKKLGFGHFSTVWLASDQTAPNKFVAIKISKSRETFQEAAQDEMKILTTIGSSEFVVQLLDQFIIWGPHGKHYCLVFEPMWKDLYNFMRKFKSPMPIPLLKVLCYQTLCGVETLHQKSIIHTDVKPENFLLSLPFEYNANEIRTERERYLNCHKKVKLYQSCFVDYHHLNKNQRRRLKEKMKGSEPNMPSEEEYFSAQEEMQRLERPSFPQDFDRTKNLIVKISDLGNACFVHKHYSSDITTRQYRSPEVILGCQYGPPVDIFSCGIMFFEMASGGHFLFNPRRYKQPYLRNEEHLAMMFRYLGGIPRYMIKDGKFSAHYFNRKCEFLHFQMEHLKPRSIEESLQYYGFPTEEVTSFANFLIGLLQPDPKRRSTATQSKLHPWLADVHANYIANGASAFTLK